MRPVSQLALLALILAGSILAAGIASAQSDDSLQRLRAHLQLHPDDSDARLRLATLLSWSGQTSQARREAQLVVARVPHHWGAQLLLARLDAWQGHYARARGRILSIYPHLSERSAALALLLQIVIWSGQPRTSEHLIDELFAYERSADLYYLLAVVERQKLHYWAAYRMAQRALRLNPLDSAAARLRSDTRLVSLDLGYSLDVFPEILGEGRYAHGTSLTATVLPEHWLNLTVFQTYQRRFATDNYRLLLQLNWRLTERLILSGFGGFGAPAEAVPRGTAGVTFSAPLGWIFAATAAYRYDRPPWGGNLHRWPLDAWAYLPAGFRLGAGYTLGALTRCGEVALLHGAVVRLHWERGPFGAGIEYGFGMELDRPSRAINNQSYTVEGCPNPGTVPHEPLPLDELRAHVVAGQLSYDITRRWSLRGGYGVYMRFDGREVHASHLGVHTWF